MSSDKQALRERAKVKLSRWAPRLLIAGLGFAAGGIAFRGTASPTAPAPPAAEGTKAQIWTCSMHPQIRANEPGQCPICGMDLIPVARDDGSGDLRANEVKLSPREVALARLNTTVAKRLPHQASQLTLLGRIEADESTLKTITAWTGGRIDRLHVRETGASVGGGQTIATLYSPEIFAAHQDLIAAGKQVSRLSNSPESSKAAAQAALDATKERLLLLGISQRDLERMAKAKRPARSVSIRSPFSGTVLERLASEGAYVTTGTPLYRIANLSRLWVQLDAYESDTARIALKQKVSIEVEALVGQRFEGSVAFIEPLLDSRKRTTRIRVEVLNKDGKLRPGMFAKGTLSIEAADHATQPLVIPATAPLFTGKRAVVYVEQPGDTPGLYAAHTVRLGPRLGEYYPVISGLAEGDRVVSRGAFALDADLQIRGGASMMSLGDDSSPGAWDEVIELAAAHRQLFAPVVAAYLKLQTALVNDSLADAAASAKALSEAAKVLQISKPAPAVGAWGALRTEITAHAGHVAMAKDLDSARQGFETLSQAIVRLLRQFGNPLADSVEIAFCPMASGAKGASWVQRGTKISNPYFGASMLTCGDIEEDVAPGAYLKAPPPKDTERPAPAAAGGHQH